jgi:drug/metabolite transporter (DMT)-like permease
MINFLLLILLVCLGSGGSIAIKIGLTSFSPALFLCLRFALAILTLIPFLKKNAIQTLIRIPTKVYLVSLLAVANVVLFAFGIRLTGVIISSILYTLIPLIIGIFSHIFLHHRFRKNEIMGALLGLIGALSIVLIPIFEGKSNINSGLIGNLLLLAAVTSFALYTVLLAPFQKARSKTELNLAFFFITFVLLFISVLISWATQQSLIISGPSIQSIFGLLFSGVLSTSFFYFLYQRLIQKGGPMYASLSFYLNPIAASIFGSIFLHERLTPFILLGASVTFLGVWIYGRK